MELKFDSAQKPYRTENVQINSYGKISIGISEKHVGKISYTFNNSFGSGTGKVLSSQNEIIDVAVFVPDSSYSFIYFTIAADSHTEESDIVILDEVK